MKDEGQEDILTKDDDTAWLSIMWRSLHKSICQLPLPTSPEEAKARSWWQFWGRGNIADNTQKSNSWNEIPANEILAKIDKGDPVEYDHVIVTGDLDLSRLNILRENKNILCESLIKITNSQILENINFSHSIFAEPINFSGTQFIGETDFNQCQFSEDVSFNKVLFGGFVDFKSAQFCRDANFIGSKFDERANFLGVSFEENASFNGSTFNKMAYFWESEFSRFAHFSNCQFNAEAVFCRLKFCEGLDFSKSLFEGESTFEISKLSGGVDFSQCQFAGETDFTGAQFEGRTVFKNSVYCEDIYFNKVLFEGYCDFNRSIFSKNVDFSGAHFKGHSDFEEVQFRGKSDFDECKFDGKYLTFKEAKFYNKYHQESVCRIAKKILENIGDKDGSDLNFYLEMDAKRRKNSWHIRYTELLFLQWIFGYGVHPFRLMFFWLLLVFGFAIVYYSREFIEGSNNFIDCMYFSLTSATTPGYGSYHPKKDLIYQSVSGLEAILGTFMWAAFITTFARKFSR